MWSATNVHTVVSVVPVPIAYCTQMITILDVGMAVSSEFGETPPFYYRNPIYAMTARNSITRVDSVFAST